MNQDNINEIILYTTPNGAVKIHVFYSGETLWLTQKSIAELFGVKVPAISKHLSNIFDSNELIENSVISKMETTEFSNSSPDSNMFFKCLLIAGTATPNKEAIAFCGSQNVSCK